MGRGGCSFSILEFNQRIRCLPADQFIRIIGIFRP